jgi:hypothetical protein
MRRLPFSSYFMVFAGKIWRPRPPPADI